MSHRSFFKDLRRTLFKSKARFLSILAIIALGVGFFAGINATEPDMIISADQYYKNQNLSDFRIISPLGFKDSDISAVQATAGVSKVQTGYAKDVFLNSAAGDIATVRLYSYDFANRQKADALNIPVLVEGRMPEKSGEIAIEASSNVSANYKIGGQVTVSLPDTEKIGDYLAVSTYTIVGRINSPLYIDFTRGQTNIGDGSIGFFAYIGQTDFSMDKYTDLFVRTTESANLTAYSDAYDQHIAPIQAALDVLGISSIAADTQAMRDELAKGKAELQENRAKAEKELADGAKKLADAEQAIIDGEKELQANETKYTKELASQREKLVQARKDLAAGQKTYETNYAVWKKGYDEYQAGAAKLAAGKAELDQAKKQLDGLQNSIAGLKNIRDGLIYMPVPMTEDAYNQLLADIRVYSPDLANNLQQYDYRTPGLTIIVAASIQTAIDQMNQAYDQAYPQYETGLAQYEAGLAELNTSKAQLDSGKAELDKGLATLQASEKKIAAGESALAAGEKKLKKELADGRKKLDDAKVQLAEGRQEYETQKADALSQIADAEAKIRDAERQILEIPDSWFVLDRNDNPGYSGYGDDAGRIGAVAKVFPLFFFLVAALVCLTTMTRMVEEERVQIGTLKALGYSTMTISSKYLVYALLASLTGALAGLLVGFRLFPGIIMSAYGMMYNIGVRLMPDHFNYAIISIFMAVATTMAASLMATLQELRAVPAVLMQPKAPKPDKRIFLERIKPFWNRLSFTRKVTARNIFRYKRRFLMTVIGIAGCTALLLTGFGLRDSINAIMGKQFDSIFVYDGLVALDMESSAAERDMSQILGNNPDVTAYLQNMNETVTALSPTTDRTYEATLLVPESTASLADFLDLHVRTTGEKLALGTDGAVISEKLANLLHVGKGDTLSWRDAENRTYEIKVAGIAENYLMHYIYMSPEYFDQVTYRAPAYNNVVFNLKDPGAIDQKSFKASLMDHESVLAVVLTRNIASDFSKNIKNLNYVVLVLILSAGALAFVVLYNLTNINITERIREIATIKVLGFRDHEVSAYVYRENIILTAIGTFVGLATGFVLHRFVMGTMEIDSMMFGKNIQILSYVLAIVLTMSFTLLVNTFMYYHLRKINMVESLKSIE